MPEVLMSAASLRRKEVESTPSRVVASTLVSEAPEPLNVVAVRIPLAELNVKFVPVFGAWSPVAAVVNTRKHSVSEDSSATGIVVPAGKLVKAEPSPLNAVAVSVPLEELNVKFVPLLGA